MLQVKEESLKDVAEYLELDYTPYWVSVEDWRNKENIQSLRIDWGDGNEVHSIEANRNLNIPVQEWEYEGINFWNVNTKRAEDGVIELRSKDGNYFYYIIQDNIEDIKKEIKATFRAYQEERQEALKLINDIEKEYFNHHTEFKYTFNNLVYKVQKGSKTVNVYDMHGNPVTCYSRQSINTQQELINNVIEIEGINKLWDEVEKDIEKEISPTGKIINEIEKNAGLNEFNILANYTGYKHNPDNKTLTILGIKQGAIKSFTVSLRKKDCGKIVN